MARTHLTNNQVRVRPALVQDKLEEHDDVLDMIIAEGASWPAPGTVQSLSGAGAVNLTTRTTMVTSTGGAQALTLADGTAALVGFRKRIVHAVDGGSSVLTDGASLNLGPGTITAITLTNAREWVELEWDGTNWNIVGCSPVGIVS